MELTSSLISLAVVVALGCIAAFSYVMEHNRIHVNLSWNTGLSIHCKQKAVEARLHGISLALPGWLGGKRQHGLSLVVESAEIKISSSNQQQNIQAAHQQDRLQAQGLGRFQTELRRLLESSHGVFATAYKLYLPALQVARLQIRKVSSDKKAATSANVLGLVFSLQKAADGAGVSLAAEFRSVEATIDAQAGHLTTSQHFGIRQNSNTSSAAACKLYLQAGSSREQSLELHAHSGIQCVTSVQLADTAQPDSPKASTPPQNPVIRGSLVLASQLRCTWGIDTAESGGGALLQVHARVDAQLAVTPSARATLQASTANMGVDFAHKQGRTTAGLRTTGSVVVSTHAGASETVQHSVGDQPAVNELTASRLNVSLSSCPLPPDPATGTGRTQATCSAAVDSLHLKSWLASTRQHGSLGMWLHDLKVLRRIVSSQGRSPLAESRSVLPPWLCADMTLKWSSLQVESHARHAAESNVSRVCVASARGSLKVETGAAASATTPSAVGTETAAAEQSPDSASSVLQDTLSAGEYAEFESRDVCDQLALRCCLQSQGLSLTTTSATSAIDAASETACGTVSLSDVLFKLNLVAFAPAMKQYAGFQRIAHWCICDGRLQPSVAGPGRHATISNAAPTCIILCGSIHSSKLQSKLHPSLPAGLKQLSPVFSQFSTSGWDPRNAPETAWFNKLARSMRFKMDVSVDQVAISCAEAGDVHINALRVCNKADEPDHAFAVEAVSDSFRLHAGGSDHISIVNPTVCWALCSVSGRGHAPGSWLPQSAETAKEFLLRTVLKEVISHISIATGEQKREDGSSQTAAFLYVERVWLAQCFAWLRLFGTASSQQVKQLNMASRSESGLSDEVSHSMSITEVSVEGKFGVELEKKAAVCVQLARSDSADVNPCLLATDFQLLWTSQSLQSDMSKPRLTITATSLALFVLQMRSRSDAQHTAPSVSSATEAAASIPQHAIPGILCNLHEIFGSRVDLPERTVQEGPAATSAGEDHPWPSVQRDILPVAVAGGVQVSMSAPPQRHLTVKTSSTRAVYSNFGLSCYKQWVLSAMEMFRAMQAAPSERDGTAALREQPVPFTWACELSEVQMILYAARDSPDSAVRGGYMSQAVGSLRIETPTLRISSLLAADPAGLRPNTTERELYSSQASARSTGSDASNWVAAAVASGGDAFASGQTPTVKTPHSGTIDWNEHNAADGVVLSPAPAARSQYGLPLPFARAKAVAREHAVHFSASDIQAYFIAPGSAVSDVSLAPKNVRGRSESDAVQMATFSWASSTSRSTSSPLQSPRHIVQSGAGDDPPQWSFGGSTERLVLQRASLYVGVGLKSLSLIDNFKLLHGQGDLAASTRVTVDVSDVQVAASLDEISEVVHVLHVALAQQNLQQVAAVPVDFSRNVAVFVGEANLTCVDGQGCTPELCIHLTEAEVNSRFRMTACGAQPAQTATKWAHSLSVTVGWVHVTANVAEGSSTPTPLGGTDTTDGSHLASVLLGGCRLDAGSTPPSIMAKGSMATAGSSDADCTTIEEATLHIFPDANAALLVSVTPERVQFLQAVCVAALGNNGADASPAAAQQELLGPSTAKIPQHRPPDLPPQEQSLLSVKSLYIARAAAVVSADGFLRKPLRHLKVNLAPLRLHDVRNGTVPALISQVSSFYTKQVWDYVPKVLKKSVLPNLRASFTPKKVAQKREMRSEQYTPWRPGLQLASESATHSDEEPEGTLVDDSDAAATSARGPRHHREQSKEAAFALLGI